MCVKLIVTMQINNVHEEIVMRVELCKESLISDNNSNNNNTTII